MFKRWRWEEVQGRQQLGGRQGCRKVSMSRRRECSLASAAKGMRRRVFWDFLHERGWKDRYVISNLGVHKKLSPKSCERCKCPVSLCRGSREWSRTPLLGWGLWDDSKEGDLLHVLGKPRLPESHDLLLPQTPSSQTNSVQVTFQRWKCWLITVLWWFKLDKILLYTFCMYVPGA